MPVIGADALKAALREICLIRQNLSSVRFIDGTAAEFYLRRLDQLRRTLANVRHDDGAHLMFHQWFL